MPRKESPYWPQGLPFFASGVRLDTVAFGHNRDVQDRMIAQDEALAVLRYWIIEASHQAGRGSKYAMYRLRRMQDLRANLGCALSSR